MELRSANLSFEANLQEKVPLLWDFGVALVSSAFSLSRCRLPGGNQGFASDFSVMGI